MAALSLYYILVSLVLISKPRTLFCTATMHGLHSRNLHVPLFPIPDDDQPQNPIFPLTPSTLNPPPPSLQTYTIPTPKPKPPEHSHPSVPIADIVLISLLSFFILVCVAFGIYYCLYELRYYKSNNGEISSPESSNSSQKRLQYVYGDGDDHDHDHVSLPNIGNSELQVVISPKLRPLPPLAHRDNRVIALAEKEEHEKLQFYSPATTLTNILTPPRNFGARTAEDSAEGSKRSPDFSSAPSSPS